MNAKQWYQRRVAITAGENSEVTTVSGRVDDLWKTQTTTKMVYLGVLILVTAVTFSAAVPLSNERSWVRSDTVTQCAVTCTESTNKFSYETGKTYEYTYESNVKTSVAGSSAEHSSLHLTANVHLEVASACEMLLRLRDVTLQDSDPTNDESRQQVSSMDEFKRALEEKTMSFAFNDGRIESICPQADDEPWAVNIRRGVLSAMQNTMSSLQGVVNTRETDVSGDCPVKYEVTSGSSGWSHVINVKKTKDLLSCKNRHDAQTIFQGTPYDSNSAIQSTPLMKSTHSCQQEVDSRSHLLTKSACVETHAFRPFAKSDSGATTEVTYQLVFTRQTDGARSPVGTSRVRSSLLFDHTLTSEQLAESMREAQQTIQQLCHLGQVDVRPGMPGLFSNLVRQMRRLDNRNLLQLHAFSKQGMCSKAEQFVRDALPVVGTSAAVSVMRHLISQPDTTEKEVEVWLTSIAFIKNPNRQMLNELKPLLSSHMSQAALPVSSVINTYCRLYDDQQSSAEVVEMVRMFENELRYNCKPDSNEQMSRMLTALRALGNAGLAMSSSVTRTLSRCANSDETPTSVRVAAINALRRVDCNTNNREDLFSLLENRQADSELRINAYLGIMQCVNEQSLARIQSMIESEEVNQVGSFIWTHLTNLQETSSPLKVNIRTILQNAELQKQFDIDKRKFSRNIELSAFSELLNVGATAESNLIWSTNSFVPRSAMLNLTFDMFGQSINLLELGGRVQGLEGLLERLFGPENNEVNSRDKRALIRDDLLNTIDSRYSKVTDNEQLSYYLRIFGNEIKAGDIFQFDVESLKNRFNFLDWLIELSKQHNIDVTRNFHFLDATLTVPTGTGLPIRLTAEGTATVGMTVSGKIDIRQMFSSPSTFDITGSVRPSAAVEVRGEMGVDAHVAKTGLKMVNTLHTSRILDGSIQLRDGRIFNLDINMPQDKIEILNAESHLYVTYREQEREQRLPASQMWEWKRCTSREVVEKTGLELCGEMSLPTGVMLPMTGPAIARIYLKKRDTYSGLHFDASYVDNRAEGTDVVRVSFNTPGSRVDREFTAEFRLDKPRREVRLDVKTPWKKVNINGGLVNQDDLKQATLRALIDDTTEYSINAEVQIDKNRMQTRYTPKLEIVIPGRQNILFDGTVTYIKGRKADVRVALRNAFSEPVTVEGSVQIRERRSSTKYDVSMQIGSQVIRGSLTGYSIGINNQQSKSWASRAELNYQWKGGRRERILINHKLRDQSTSNLKAYSSDCSWSSTLWSRYNGQAGFEVSFSPNSLRTKIEAGLDNVRKVTIITSGAYDFSGRDKKVNGLIKFTLPYKDLDYEIKLDHLNNWDSLQSNATVKYGTTQQPVLATLDVGVRKESSRPLNVVGEARLKYPGRELTVTQRLTEREPRDYYNTLSIHMQRGFQASVVSTYKMHNRHEMTNEITINNQPPIRVNGHLLPNLRNAQARLDVGFRGKTYLMDASWRHRGNMDNFNTRASGEVTYADHSLGLSGELTRRNEEFQGSVEAKLNQNKRYALSGQLTAAMMTPKLQARFEWPENFVAVEGTGKYEHRGWYRTTNDLEASAKLTSSLRGFEEISANFVHDQTGSDNFRTNGEVSWAQNKKITGTLTVESRKATLSLTTPFNGYQTITAETSYSVRGMAGSLNSSVRWDGQQVMLLLTGDMNRPSERVTARAAFRSPFRYLENLSANYEYSVNGDRYQTTADVSWARGQQVSAAITMNHRRYGYSLVNNGEMTISTPFQGCQTNKLTWNHQNTMDRWNSHHELEIDSRKFVLDVQGSHQLTNNLRKVTTRVSFDCPRIYGYDWLQDALVNIEYEHELYAWKSSAKSELRWGRYAFGYEHDVNIQPYAAAVITAKVTTPYPGYEQMGIGLNNRKSGNTWTANNELVLGRHGKVTLDGSLSYNGPVVDGMIRLTTPLSQLERVVANIRNTRQNDGVWAAHADFQYAPDRTMSVDGKLGWENEKTLQLEVSSPFRYMRRMRFTAGFSGTWKNFQASTELRHNLLRREKLSISVQANVMNPRNMQGELEIQTPFDDFSLLKVTAQHVRDTDVHVTTTGSWQFNRYTGSLNYDANIRSWVDWDERVELEYINGKKISMTSTFQIGDKIVATATFSSPFEVARTASFSFTEEGPLDNFKISSELVYNQAQRITGNMEFRLRENSLRTFFRMTTPYEAAERVALNINWSGTAKQFSLDSSAEFNDKKVTKTMNFRTGERNGEVTTELNGRLEIPHRQYHTTTYSLNRNQNADFTRWSENWAVETGGKRYHGQTEFSMTDTELQFSTASYVPEEYSLRLTHRGDFRNDFTNNLIIKFAEHRITETSTFKMTPQLIEARTSIETTFRNYESFNAAFKHEGTVGDFTTTASLATPFRQFRRMSTELTFRGVPNEFTSQLKLNLPFDSLRRLRIQLNHRGVPTDLNSGLTITYNDKTITSSFTFKNNPRTTEASLNVQTPYDGFRNFGTQFSFSGELTNFRASASVNLPIQGYDRFSISVTHRGDLRGFQTTGQIETSIRDWQTINVRLEHSASSWEQIRSSASVVIPAGTISASLTHSGDLSNFRSGLDIRTPFRGFTTFTVSIEHEGGLETPKTTIAVQTPFRGYERFGLTLSKTGSLRNLQLSAELTTPIRRAERTAFSWSHNYDRNSLELTVSLESSCDGYERLSASFSNSITRRSVRTTAQLQTSIRGYNKFEASSEFASNYRGFRWTASAETPIRGYERWNGRLEHGPGDNGDGFKTTIQATTPIRDYNNFGATLMHTGDATQFRTTLQVQTPFRQAPQIDVTLNHRGSSIRDFSTTASVEYAGKKIDGEASFRIANARLDQLNYEGTLKLSTTACRYFRDFSLTASHNRQQTVKTGSLEYVLNGEKKIDFDYSYTTSGDRNININVRSPYPVSTRFNMEQTGQGSAVLNWDPTNRHRQVRFDFGLKNVETSSQTDRSVNFKTTVARRIIGFGVGYTLTGDRLTSRGELYWDSDRQSDFSYNIEASQTSRRGLVAYDGRLRVQSRLFNTDSSFSHKVTGGSRHTTEIVLDATERLTIKSDLNTATYTGYSHSLTIQHPRLTRDVTVLTEGTRLGFKTTLSYDRHTWAVEGTLVDESSGSDPKYSGSLRLSNPSSYVDVQLGGNIGSDYYKTSGGLSLKYMTSRDRQLKTLALKTEVNKQRKELKLEVESPLDTVKLTTSNREVDIDRGVVRYDVSAESKRFNVRTTLDFSRPDRSLNFKYYKTSANYVQLFGQYVSPTQMSFEVSRSVNGASVKDAELSLSFNEEERLLTGRSYLRPRLWNDVKAFFNTDNYDTRQLNRDVNELKNTFRDDLQMKKYYLNRAIAEPASAVANYVSGQLASKRDQVNAAFNEMYYANEFYIRDIHQALKRHYDDLSRRMQYKMYELKRNYARWSAEMQEKMREYSEAWNRFKYSVSRRVDEWKRTMDDNWRKIQPSFAHIRPHLDNFIEAIKSNLMDLVDRIRRNPRFREMINRLTTMDPSDYFLPPSQWQDRLMALADKVDQKIQQFLDKREVHYVREWVVRTLQNNNWLYEFLGLENQVNEWIRQLRSLTWDTIKSKTREAATNYFQLHKTRWTVWDPRRGEYVFQVYIPFNLPDVSFVSRFDPRPLLNGIKNWIVSKLPEEELTLLDAIHVYKPPSDVSEWVPPFKGHASLTGPQHYMTFDKRFFEFAGECSYLLARDFISGTFSVIVNYDRPVNGQPVKKSLTVISGGRQVEVFPDGKVTVDGSRVEMPVLISNTTVKRTGNMIAVTDTWRGVDVTCDLPHDYCTLGVSGWYYGKTAGLFGTFDNEPYNDLTTIDKTLTESPETMADSWTVGRRCRPVNRAVTVTPEPYTRRYKACAKLFKEETSSFRTCYRVVDPEPFMTICLNDQRQGDNSLEAETDICRPASTYVHECRRREVHVRMPKQCVSCEVPSTDIKFYDMDTVQLDQPSNIPRAADIVFVVQHSPCNRELLGKIIGLVDDMDKAMRSERLTSTRYAVVGFGGKKLHLTNPHEHTMDGQTFNSANKLSLALDSFDLEPDSEPDIMAALAYASRLPFRAGASKTVILLACDACRETGIRYIDVQRMLLGVDTHLHVLVQGVIQLRSRSPKTAYIYGVDEDTVYTRKDVAGDELEGEPDLRRYISLPKDLCVALTQDTNGSVFSARTWLDSRPLTQKQFVDVMVRTIARKAQPSDCQTCHCSADAANVGTAACQSCTRRDPIYTLLPDFDDDDFDDGDDDTTSTDTQTNESRPNRRRGQGRRRLNRPRNGRRGRRQRKQNRDQDEENTE